MAFASNNDLLETNDDEKIETITLSEFKADEHNKGKPTFCSIYISNFQNDMTCLKINGFLTLMVLLLSWSILGEKAYPGTNLFSMVVIYITSHVCGILINKIHLPDLLGMLIAGMLLRNVHILNLSDELDLTWLNVLRGTALTIILLRAGMGLDPEALKRLSFAVIRLAFTPCIVEMITSGVVAHYLFDLKWNHAFVLGSVMSAVSPAVVVPGMLSLSIHGYGVEKGIPTLLIASSSIDDVLAISVFGILVGVSFSGGSIAYIAIKPPIEIILGSVYGLTLGSLLWHFPQAEQSRRMFLRLIFLLLSALTGFFLSARIGFGGAGPYAVLLIGFWVQVRWRKETYDSEIEKDYVSVSLEIIWSYCKPFLFGLIGYEVSFVDLEPEMVQTGIAVLAIELVFRMLTTFLVVSGNNFSNKEKIFIAFAWVPKATVQAAIGGIPKARVKEENGTDEELKDATKIANMAVLGIMISAPLGAIAINTLGTKLLKRNGTRPNQIAPVVDSQNSTQDVS